jgi:predicted RNA-binding Zn-ribbon protein involved in translation (DUF1610 family)
MSGHRHASISLLSEAAEAGTFNIFPALKDGDFHQRKFSLHRLLNSRLHERSVSPLKYIDSSVQVGVGSVPAGMADKARLAFAASTVKDVTLRPTISQSTHKFACAGLNRAILDQGWSMFRTMLAYKLAERGGRLVEVPAAYTSQTCPVCGHVSAANRQNQADFVCVACGHAANADTNAAINILRRADSALKPAEEHRAKRPDEAGTSRRKAA